MQQYLFKNTELFGIFGEISVKCDQHKLVRTENKLILDQKLQIHLFLCEAHGNMAK